MKSLLLILAALPFALLNLRAADPAKSAPFDLTTIYGETYTGCHIYKVTPANVTLVYDGGVAKVSFEYLDEAWKRRYHYDPDKASAYQQKEEASRKRAMARQREFIKKREREQNEAMRVLIEQQEKADRDAEARWAKMKAEHAAESDIPPVPPPLAPYPGDPPAPSPPPSPPPSGNSSGPGSVVPILPPLGPVFTPTFQQPAATSYNGSNDPSYGYGNGYGYDYNPYWGGWVGWGGNIIVQPGRGNHQHSWTPQGMTRGNTFVVPQMGRRR